MNFFLFILGLVALVGVIYTILYNGLVSARQKVKEAWSGIDVQLKRRYDLIPNLVKTVKGYAAHEKGTLESLTQARAAAMAVPKGHIAEKASAENAISGTLKTLFALAENYPDLKASSNFHELQVQLAETEDQIASSRRIYNGNVTEMNVKVESFPSNIVAKKHGFTKEEFFDLDEGEKEGVKNVPQVKF